MADISTINGNNSVGQEAVKEIARRIARESPELSDLTQEQLSALAKIVIRQRLADRLNKHADVAGINWKEEKAIYLMQISSLHTKDAYRRAIERLEVYTTKFNLNPLELTPRAADDYIYNLKTDGRAPESIRRDIAAISAFYTWLERRHANMKNPFRGTKARPKKQAVKKCLYPSQEEADVIISALDEETAVAVLIMSLRGLRVGSLPGLTIRAGRFSTKSKGKDISGEMPPEIIKAIKKANLDSRNPFNDLTGTKIKDRIRYTTGKLCLAGKIQAAYSAHDFRLLFAVTQYRKDRDIYKLKQLLSHASIGITEMYLKGLGEIQIISNI